MEILKDIWDRSGILELASVGLGVLSVGIAIYIACKQSKQMTSLEALTKSIDENVLGTLGEFDHVLDLILKLLDEANRDENSTVYFMAYWLWFGVDKDEMFKTRLSEITRDRSHFFLKLRGRVAANKRTTVVAYDNEENISKFVNTLVAYGKTNGSVDGDGAAVKGLVTNYMKDIVWVQREAAGVNSNVLANFCSEIPAIIFAVEGKVSAGIWYIGETAMLKKRSQLGGFVSRQPAMVGMLIDQVKRFAIPPSDVV